MTLRKWIEDFKAQFDERELDFRTVQKASLAVQLIDGETGLVHIHNVKFKAPDALDLAFTEHFKNQ